MARKKSPVPNPGSPPNADNFKLIKGIGPTLASRLHDAGIITYRQLSSLTPAELAARVKGLFAKQIALQDWAGQARILSSKKSTSRSSKRATPKKAIHQHYENFTLEFLVDEKHAVRRTRVAHIQSGDADTWAGWETGSLIDFLARHTGVRVPVKIPEKWAYSVDLNRDFHDGNSEPQTAELEVEPLTTRSIPSPAVPVMETTLPTLTFPIVAPMGGTLCLRKLEVMTPSSNHPVTLLRQDQPYLVRLTLDLSDIDAPGDLPLLYKASVVSRQLGGTHRSIGEIVSTLRFSKSINMDINGISLLPGTYRLEAFAEIRYDEATPGLTASLKGGLLQVY